MIIQIANIIGGAVLATPLLKRFVDKSTAFNTELILARHLKTVGMIELVLGFIALLLRLDMLPLHIANFGASFPQAFSGMLVGTVLASEIFDQYPTLTKTMHLLLRYQVLIGIFGIAVGLGSLLFGCPFPLVCGQLFH